MKLDNKYLKKLKQQERSNPGKKEKRKVLPRGRSSVFHSKKEYNRNRYKQELRKEEY